MEFSSDNKLKSYLKTESKRLGISIQNTYNTFFSRILLERVSKMSYDSLYVKGSFSEIAHLNKMIRPITDIDLVSTKSHNDSLITLYRAMCDTNGSLYYELTDIPKQTKTGIYKIHTVAHFGKIQHPISIDFQELSNTIYEKDYKRIEPIFRGDSYFYIYTPSYEEHLAEKMCIVVESNKANVLNTRVKDFYDIYKLCGGKYNEEKLSYFFYNMLKDRKKIKIEDVSVDHLNQKYILNHQELWNMMSKKYEFLDKEISFDEAVFKAKEKIQDEIENLDKQKVKKIRLNV